MWVEFLLLKDLAQLWQKWKQIKEQFGLKVKKQLGCLVELAQIAH